MKRKLIHIWQSTRYVLILAGIFVILGFTSSRLASRRVADISVRIDNQFENYFIDRHDVLNLVNDDGKDYLLNSSHATINLKELETRIESHQFVRDAQAYMDIEGNLSIDVQQNRPIARVINPEGSDFYISSDGEILPESAHYTARVILIQLEDMNWLPEYSLLDARGGEKIFQLLNVIIDDAFWSAQVAGIYLQSDLELYLMPQVTKSVVAFGEAEDIDMKLKKLKTYYKKILPYKGWNAYDTVNLKFKNQIVCKK